MSLESDAKVVVKDVEVGAEKVLNFVTKAEKVTPVAAAALGTLLGAVKKAIQDGQGAAGATGLNITLDEQTFTDLKAAWGDLTVFVNTLGIKL